MGTGTRGDYERAVENVDAGTDEEPETSTLYSRLSLYVLHPWPVGTEYLVCLVLPYFHGPLLQMPALLLWGLVCRVEGLAVGCQCSSEPSQHACQAGDVQTVATSTEIHAPWQQNSWERSQL